MHFLNGILMFQLWGKGGGDCAKWGVLLRIECASRSFLIKRANELDKTLASSWVL